MAAMQFEISRPQWVSWTLELDQELRPFRALYRADGKTTASASEPESWGDYASVRTSLNGQGGVAYCDGGNFTAYDVVDDDKLVPASDIDVRTVAVTFFHDCYARSKYERELTLEQLAGWIRQLTATAKEVLPWLKLCRFGNQHSTRNCLRTDHNMIVISGVEGEHDAGTMSFDEAVELLTKANVACLIYTSPSYQPGERERWRVLCPTSVELPPEERDRLLERLNGILEGEVEPESFTRSQSYYHGHAEGREHREVVIKGRYIDLADEIVGCPKILRARDGSSSVAPPRDSVHGYSMEELKELLERSRIRRHGPTGKGEWHLSMLTVSASLVMKGWTDTAIYDFTADYCDAGWGDPDMAVLISTAREKFERDDPEVAVRGLQPLLAALAAERGGQPTYLLNWRAPSETEMQQVDGVVTQDSIAQVFARRFANVLRFCHHTGAWFVWTDTHWQKEDTALAFDFCRRIGREFTSASNKTEMKEVRKVGFAGGVEKFAKSDRAFAVTSQVWDRDPFLLGTPGGTVDLRSGELRAADACDGISKITAVAPAETVDCPRWLSFLDETFNKDKEMIRFIKQWNGYGLTGDIREEALLFGFGNGKNGKSVWLNTVARILHDYAVTAAMETFTAAKYDRHPTELAVLRGARLVTASETEEGRAWAESRIKQITGGDTISARFMRQDFFEFTPQFKLTIIGNHKPVLRNVDEAARRRFRFAPFLCTPVMPDLQLKEKLRAEWPGILRWMIEGCLDWQRNGLLLPQAVTQATNNYFDEQDLMAQWLAEKCDVKRAEKTLFETTAQLFASWGPFAAEAGGIAGTQTSFSVELTRRGFEKAKDPSGNARGFRGVKLKPLLDTSKIKPPAPG